MMISVGTCWVRSLTVLRAPTSKTTSIPSAGDEAGARRVTENSDVIRIDRSILNINRCRMAGQTLRCNGSTRRRRSARLGKPSTKLKLRQLDTSTRHTERTSGCCRRMVGSAPSSAASRFWCCHSLDHLEVKTGKTHVVRTAFGS